MLWIALLAACTLAAGCRAADADCHGHGTLSADGSCACDNAWPGPGEAGWTGENCEIPLFGSDGQGDLAAGCQDDGCADLAPGDWVCFVDKFSWGTEASPESWNHYAVQVKRISEDASGDPDLFILLAGVQEIPDGTVPSTTGANFTLADASAGSIVAASIRRDDYHPRASSERQGAYVCVHAYQGGGAVKVAVHVHRDSCPVRFGRGDAALVCSTPVDESDPGKRRFDGCSDEGTCQCVEPWSKPVPDVYSGLGFEDCSARAVRLNESAFSEGVARLPAERIGSKHWSFVGFPVEEGDAQVVVEAAIVDGPSASGLTLYAKYGAPPGAASGQHDIRATWDRVTHDRAVHLTLDRGAEPYRPGEWWVGVVGVGKTVSYEFSVSRFSCPSGCSGNGYCNTPSGVCTCIDGYVGVACERQLQNLTWDGVVNVSEAEFEYEVYQLDPLPEDAALANAKVYIEASYSAETYPHWKGVHPAVLLSPGNGTTFPSANNYTYRISLGSPASPERLTLCPSLLGSDAWQLSVYNPASASAISFTLELHVEMECPPRCEQHGHCIDDGRCECNPGWAGVDCSVATPACQEGTLRATPKPDAHGTCWDECVCGDDGRCDYSNKCSAFTCDEAGAGETRWRRRGGELECVQDSCRHDVVSLVNDAVCVRNCTCGAADGPCQLDPKCTVLIDRVHRGGSRVRWFCAGAILAGVVVVAYVRRNGLPTWLRVRDAGFDSLYQELYEG